MKNAESQIKSRVDSFVNDLSGLVRRAALEAVTEALQANGATARRPGRPAKVASAPKASKPAKSAAGAKTAAGKTRGRPPKAAPRRRAGEKRTPEQLADLTAQVLGAIQVNPDQGVELLAKELGMPTKELALPIKKLLADRKITSKGQKRATKYTTR